MVPVSAEARRLFEKDSHALWRESLGLLARLGPQAHSVAAGAEPSAELRSLVRRFLHAIHSLKGLLAMLPETAALASRLQAVEALLSFRSPAEVIADSGNWSSVARQALQSVEDALGRLPDWTAGESSVPPGRGHGDGGGIGSPGIGRAGGTSSGTQPESESDSGWIVHLEEDGTLRTFWISAARVELWIDVHPRQAGRDMHLGWAVLGDEWVRVLGGRNPGGSPVRGAVLRLHGGEAVLVYTDSVEWLVPRERARLQGLERLEVWARRRSSSLVSKGSITPVETHFDVGHAKGSGSRAA